MPGIKRGLFRIPNARLASGSTVTSSSSYVCADGGVEAVGREGERLRNSAYDSFRVGSGGARVGILSIDTISGRIVKSKMISDEQR